MPKKKSSKKEIKSESLAITTPTASNEISNITPSNVELASIYSRIAEFESNRTEKDYLDSVKILIDDETRDHIICDCNNDLYKLRCDIESELKNNSINANSSTNNEVKDNENDIETTIDDTYCLRLHQKIKDKIEMMSKLEQILFDLGKTLKTLYTQEDHMKIEQARLLHEIEVMSTMSHKLQDTCRIQQQRNKSIYADYQQLCSTEEDRTVILQKSCEQSIEEVIQSVQKEELLLHEKETQNAELRTKIEELYNHIHMKKIQVENANKMKRLQHEIYQTKKQQYDYNQEQNRLLQVSLQSRIDTQRDKVKILEVQVYNYTNKFYEFEKTLQDTEKLFVNVENRGKEIAHNAYTIEQKNQKIFSSAERKQKELEIIINQKMVLDHEYQQLIRESRIEEEKCRNLQTQRANLNKQLVASTTTTKKIQTSEAGNQIKSLDHVNKDTTTTTTTTPVTIPSGDDKDNQAVSSGDNTNTGKDLSTITIKEIKNTSKCTEPSIITNAMNVKSPERDRMEPIVFTPKNDIKKPIQDNMSNTPKVDTNSTKEILGKDLIFPSIIPTTMSMNSNTTTMELSAYDTDQAIAAITSSLVSSMRGVGVGEDEMSPIGNKKQKNNKKKRMKKKIINNNNSSSSTSNTPKRTLSEQNPQSTGENKDVLARDDDNNNDDDDNDDENSDEGQIEGIEGKVDKDKEKDKDMWSKKKNSGGNSSEMNPTMMTSSKSSSLLFGTSSLIQDTTTTTPTTTQLHGNIYPQFTTSSTGTTTSMVTAKEGKSKNIDTVTSKLPTVQEFTQMIDKLQQINFESTFANIPIPTTTTTATTSNSTNNKSVKKFKKMNTNKTTTTSTTTTSSTNIMNDNDGKNIRFQEAIEVTKSLQLTSSPSPSPSNLSTMNPSDLAMLQTCVSISTSAGNTTSLPIRMTTTTGTTSSTRVTKLKSGTITTSENKDDNNIVIKIDNKNNNNKNEKVEEVIGMRALEDKIPIIFNSDDDDYIDSDDSDDDDDDSEEEDDEEEEEECICEYCNAKSFVQASINNISGSASASASGSAGGGRKGMTTTTTTRLNKSFPLSTTTSTSSSNNGNISMNNINHNSSLVPIAAMLNNITTTAEHLIKIPLPPHNNRKSGTNNNNNNTSSSSHSKVRVGDILSTIQSITTSAVHGTITTNTTTMSFNNNSNHHTSSNSNNSHNTSSSSTNEKKYKGKGKGNKATSTATAATMSTLSSASTGFTTVLPVKTTISTIPSSTSATTTMYTRTHTTTSTGRNSNSIHNIHSSNSSSHNHNINPPSSSSSSSVYSRRRRATSTVGVDSDELVPSLPSTTATTTKIHGNIRTTLSHDMSVGKDDDDEDEDENDDEVISSTVTVSGYPLDDSILESSVGGEDDD